MANVIRDPAHRGRTSSPARRGEGGFSFVENLVALVLVAIVFGGLAAGVLLAMRASSSNERDVDAVTSLANVTEEMKAADYVPCAPPAALAAPFAERRTAAGRALEVEVTQVRYWDTGAQRFEATCPPDGGAQLVTVRVSVGESSVAGEVVLRNPELTT